MSNFPVNLNDLPIVNQFLRMLRVVSDISNNDVFPRELGISEKLLYEIEYSDMVIDLPLINKYAKYFCIRPSTLLKCCEDIKAKLATAESSSINRHKIMNKMTIKFIAEAVEDQNELPF